MQDEQKINRLAEKIWKFSLMSQKLEKADLIFVLGSHDTRVAERAVELFDQGWAPLIVFSGGLGRFTAGNWAKTEAETFAAIAEKLGVPKEAILLEDRATNTSENVLFTKQLIEERGLAVQKLIAVQKPYMERRTYATIKKRWPEVEVIVTSPQLSFEKYQNDKYPKSEVICYLVGDLQRLKLYGQKGYSIEQNIPQDVWQAYEELVSLGFDNQLSKES